MGAHTITLVVTDDDGATGIDTVVIQVTSSTATTPVANIKDYPALVDTDGVAGEPVILDGSASYDPERWPHW